MRSSATLSGPAAAPARRSAAGVATVRHEPDGAAIADAKRSWLTACADGSSAARVQRLYETYRDLVIGQVAAAVQGSKTHAS